ncbi:MULTISPECIES: class C sortase [Helcococcus]|uniref:Class C sortase n=1 Tax=Helcococcus bovis TaxID=3153252 RepID=A0ABW9F7D4_9FIRM
MKKANKRKIIFYFLFVLGLMISSYPFISQWYYRIEANEEIRKFNRKISEMDPKDIEKRLELARAYNSTLKTSTLVDPYSKKQKEEGVKAYANMLKVQEKIGYIDIPKIGESLPIYAGTSESILQKGAGHLEGTSLPVGGENTHSVITAHCGLPTAKLFTDLDKMKKGDKFYIHVLNQVLAYEVDQILTVEPTNFEPVLVQPNKDYVTLLTCTPYMVNSHRLLVRGHRVPYVSAIDDGIMNDAKPKDNYKIYLIISVLFILILLWYIYKKRKEIRKINSELKEKNL